MQYPAPASGTRRNIFIALAIVGTLVYVSVAIAVDARRLSESLVRLGLGGSAAVLALSLANYVLRFTRWHLYLARLGHNLPVFRHLLYYCSGFAFTVSPGKAGEAMRSLYLRPYGVTYAESFATLFVERVLDVLAMAVLAGSIAAGEVRYRMVAAMVLAATIVAIVILSRPALPKLLERLHGKYAQHRFGKLFHTCAGALHTSSRLLQPASLVMGTILGLVAWGTEGSGLYLICQGLNLDVTLSQAVGIYAIAILVGSAAVFMPAGIGGTEVIMTTLLVAHGAGTADAVIATLLCRLATLWFAVLIGLATTIFLELTSARQRAASVP